MPTHPPVRRPAEMMSYWTFSDVFEEQGVVKTPFYGGFGLLAERSILSRFNDFALLHRLGDTRLDVNSIASSSRPQDGSLAIAAWSLFLPKRPVHRKPSRCTSRISAGRHPRGSPSSTLSASEPLLGIPAVAQWVARRFAKRSTLPWRWEAGAHLSQEAAASRVPCRRW